MSFLCCIPRSESSFCRWDSFHVGQLDLVSAEIGLLKHVSCVQFLFHYHVIIIHVHRLLSGCHLIPPYLQTKGIILQKVIFKDPRLKSFFSSLDFNIILHKSVDVRSRALFLSLENLSQSGFNYQPYFPSSEVRRELFIKISP